MAEQTRKRGGAGAPPDGADGDLREEIAMLRAILRRVHDQAGAAQSTSDLLRILDGLSRASVRLAELIKAQRELDESQSAAGALSEALEEVIKKWSMDSEQ